MTENIERHVPQHPLPEELQKMGRDETVCKYCGVSYLIHRELKSLEDKLALIEKELQYYKDCEQKEKQMRAELTVVQNELAEHKGRANARDTEIKSLNEQLKSKTSEVERLKSTNKDLQDRMGKAIQSGETIKLKHNLLLQSLPSLMLKLQQQRSALQNIQTFVEHKDRTMKEDFQKLESTVKRICTKELSDVQKIQSRVVDYENENMSLKDREQQLQTKISFQAEQIQKLKTSEGHMSQLTTECNALKDQVQDLKADLEQTTSKSRAMGFQAEQYKEQLRAKTQEIDNLNTQLRKRDISAENTVARLQREIKQREGELEMTKNELKSIQKQMEDQRRMGEEIKRKASANQNQSEEIRNQMYRMQEELTALKAERESMISSHQNRIEQLRESFKKKLYDAEKWPEKLEETLREERQKHIRELQENEEKLQANFNMELQIEKQKHQELLQKYRSEFRESDSKIQSRINELAAKHKEELVELQRQMRDVQTHSQEKENSLRSEVQSLKNIINDLENRLGKLDSGNDELVLELKAKLLQSSQELDDVKSELTALERELNTAKEDNEILQDTVRRECEERFELTETLSNLKEELLQYKRPGAGFSQRSSSSPSSQRAPSRSNSLQMDEHPLRQTSSTGSLNNSSSNPPIPHPPAGQPHYMTSTAVNMGFDGDRVKTPARGIKGNSVSGERKRIAAAMGRR